MTRDFSKRRKPAFKLPPGATDAHCHVFGPGAVFPYAPNRRYTPEDAPKEDLAALHAHLGIDRAVIVQASCHGSDNRAMLDALAWRPKNYRGVAIVDAQTPPTDYPKLALAGVRGVQISLHAEDLHLTGSTSAGQTLTLKGRACASEQAMLDDLQVEQRREGDQLIIEVARHRGMHINLFGSSYSALELNVDLPASMPVSLAVGSGDAEISGLQQLQSNVGSGDLHVHQVSGKFATSVGSGDVDATDIGSLDLGSVGSGDFKAAGITGDARVGSVGSGDVVLRKVGGSVHADTLGSGDFTVSDVAGDFSLGAKGSGDVNHSGVKGKVSVPHDNNDSDDD